MKRSAIELISYKNKTTLKQFHKQIKEQKGYLTFDDFFGGYIKDRIKSAQEDANSSIDTDAAFYTNVSLNYDYKIRDYHSGKLEIEDILYPKKYVLDEQEDFIEFLDFLIKQTNDLKKKFEIVKLKNQTLSDDEFTPQEFLDLDIRFIYRLSYYLSRSLDDNNTTNFDIVNDFKKILLTNNVCQNNYKYLQDLHKYSIRTYSYSPFDLYNIQIIASVLLELPNMTKEIFKINDKYTQIKTRSKFCNEMDRLISIIDELKEDNKRIDTDYSGKIGSSFGLARMGFLFMDTIRNNLYHPHEIIVFSIIYNTSYYSLKDKDIINEIIKCASNCENIDFKDIYFKTKCSGTDISKEDLDVVHWGILQSCYSEFLFADEYLKENKILKQRREKLENELLKKWNLLDKPLDVQIDELWKKRISLLYGISEEEVTRDYSLSFKNKGFEELNEQDKKDLYEDLINNSIKPDWMNNDNDDLKYINFSNSLVPEDDSDKKWLTARLFNTMNRFYGTEDSYSHISLTSYIDSPTNLNDILCSSAFCNILEDAKGYEKEFFNRVDGNSEFLGYASRIYSLYNVMIQKQEEIQNALPKLPKLFEDETSEELENTNIELLNENKHLKEENEKLQTMLNRISNKKNKSIDAHEINELVKETESLKSKVDELEKIISLKNQDLNEISSKYTDVIDNFKPKAKSLAEIISDRTFIIIGGRQEVVSKLASKYPLNFRINEFEEKVTRNALSSADYIAYFSRNCSHKIAFRVRENIEDTDRICYIDGNNIERIEKQIIYFLEKQDEKNKKLKA